MAISANTVWEVRTTGNDTQCGGGFDATIAGAGTDYSQQNSAQATGTVTSSTTTVTATAGIFTAAMVGNSITDGTAYKQITGYTSATVVTVDSAPAWTSATVYVGGALASPGKAAGIYVSGNTIYIKSGIYTISTATANVSGGIINFAVNGGGNNFGVHVIGYNIIRNDKGIKPLLQVVATGVSSIVVITLSGVNSYLDNVTVDGNLASAIRGVNCNNYGSIVRCKIINCTNMGLSLNGSATTAMFCEISNCTTTSPAILNNGSNCIQCISHDNTIAGFRTQSGNFERCLSYNNIQHGFEGAGNYGRYIGCVAYNNRQNGFQMDGPTHTLNCLATNNGGYGYNAGQAVYLINCAAYSNTSGTFAGGPVVEGFVTLTAMPFNNAASGDFSLNNLAASGGACRNAGYGIFPGLSSTTGYQDIGAVQHKDPLKIRGRLGDGR